MTELQVIELGSGPQTLIPIIKTETEESGNLSGGAKCAIAKDYIKGVLMNTVDEVLDIFSVVSAFIGSSSGSVKGRAVKGSLSLCFLFLPGIFAGITKKSPKDFVKMLPVINIGHFFRLSKDVVECRKSVDKCQAGFRELVTPDDEANLEKENEKLRMAEGKLMSCKVYQLAEAAPQFVLQSAYLLQDYGLGKLPKLGGDCTWSFVWTVVKTLFSLASVTLTTTSVFTSMPVETESEQEQSPLRSSSYKYGKILPNVVFVTTARLVSLSLIFSLASDNPDKPEFYLPYIFGFLVLYMICFRTLKKVLRKRDPQKREVLKNRFLQGFFTSIIGPCIIGRIHSPFFMVSSIMSSVFHAMGLAVLLILSFTTPKTILHYNHHNATKCHEEPPTVPVQARALQLYSYILIPLILLSILLSYLMYYLFEKENVSLIVKNMIDSSPSDLDGLKAFFYKNKDKGNLVVNKKKFETALVYACRTGKVEVMHLMLENHQAWQVDCKYQNVDGESVLIVAVKNGDVDNVRLLMGKAREINLDLNAIDCKDRTALMIGCFEKQVESVKVMFEMDRDKLIHPNRNDKNLNTAFILACKPCGDPMKDARRPEMVELFRHYAKPLGIDLKAKNKDGLSASDFYSMQ